MISKVQESLIHMIPEEFQDTFQKVLRIDEELRCTDVRLIHDPTDDQITHFLELLDEGDELAETFPIKEIEAIIGKNINLINYISNFKEILRVQRTASGYVWRRQIAIRRKREEDEAS